jgi:hypothetical protein
MMNANKSDGIKQFKKKGLGEGNSGSIISGLCVFQISNKHTTMDFISLCYKKPQSKANNKNIGYTPQMVLPISDLL